MAWLPIAYTVPQYFDPDTNQPYSGAVLKAYQVGTTTNIPFATTNEGTTTANSIALNASGYPEVGGNVVIPHLDQDYKLALYPDQASADADSGADWIIDDIDLIQTTDTASAADYNVWPLVDYGGAKFDGTNDYLTRGAGLTGASDGKKGTIVAFVTFDATATAIEYVVHSTGGAFILRRDADGVFRVIAENSGGSTILNMATSSAYNDTDTVYCVMASWDLATPGSNQLYVNDTSDVVTTTFTNDTIDYTVADWAVGADVSGSNKLTGNVLSVWLDTTDNLDFDTELNRRRFLDESDNPVYLGVQGELVTGTQPILFLGNFDTSAFVINRGSGGDLTENGTLTAASVAFDGQYKGTAINEASPPGITQMYAGSSEPFGWLFCSGAAVSRTKYADLFDAIGTTYGVGDGSTTFNVPDLRDRSPLGENTMGASDAGRVGTTTTALGDSGGEDEHTLTNSEMPSHNHGGSTGGAGSHTHSIDLYEGSTGSTNDRVQKSQDNASDSTVDANTNAVGNHTHSISNAGSDGSHNNMPPFLVMNFIIKT